ncbi:hypothetical protein L195_g063728, partial [Trifolium pratense]
YRSALQANPAAQPAPQPAAQAVPAKAHHVPAPRVPAPPDVVETLHVLCYP